MNATYSPEDNKLRLYAETRLSETEYSQARSAGFIWAPKQELFVAPAWTPEREDLLLDWCGEIGDEDKSLVERQEERAERFEVYSEHRKEDAEQAHKAVSAIADGIPLGQPILVGHHSEKRARRDAEKIENGMRKAVKMWDQSKYWEDRARGAIRHAKYKERPDVRARRIKKLEAEKRSRERSKVTAERGLRFWSGGFKLKNKTGEVRPLEITEENRDTIRNVIGNDSDLSYLPMVKHPTLDQHWHAWDVLRPDGERYRECPAMTIKECQERGLEHYPRVIAYHERWIAHYENRLTYERAMLADAGGTVSDQKTPEKGGACKCWVNRGHWCEIIKVNKVSVSVADNWGNGGEDFLRTVPFDKLSAIISREEWETMKAGGTRGGRQPGWQQKEHAEAMSKPKEDGKACEKFVALVNDGNYRGTYCCTCGEKEESHKATPKAADFEALRDTLKAGVQVVSAPQLFPTPPELAKRVVELAFEDGWGVQICAEMNERCRILEPSAGTGNLLAAIREAAKEERSTLYDVVAVEVNQTLAHALLVQYGEKVICADFLTRNGDLGKFDRIVMNPPFAHGADIKHILHALTFLNPGGRLVAICANGPRQQAELQPLADQWIEMEEAFAEAGTNVRTAIAVFTK